jgi:hypothetical protein
MALDLAGLGGLLPGGQAFNRIAGDVLDIANTLGGVLGGGAPAQQQPAVARPADQFQAPAAPQQAALQGPPQQFGAAINQILQALTQITQLLTQLTGKGGQGQAQAPAVGVGQGQQTPGQVGGAAPQAPAGGQNAVGGPQVQGGQGTLRPQPQPGVDQNLLLHGVGTTLVGLGEICQAIAGGRGAGQPGVPNPGDAGGLSCSADSKVVTTSGGYKIKCDGAQAWSITGPDGQPVKVHGDPHVNQKNGNFDFKKDSTFVLPDGTRINCKTKDLGNGTSVSDQLEITNNGQRAIMDVSKGDGKVTQVDRGGEQFHTDQTFTMGADGNFGINGKTITGNEGGKADAFKLGGDQQLTQQATAAAGAAAGAGQAGGLQGLLQQIQGILAGLGGAQAAQGTAPAQGTQPAAGGNEVGQQAPVQNQPAATPPAQQARPIDVVGQLLQAIVGMLNALLPLLAGGGGQPRIQGA